MAYFAKNQSQRVAKVMADIFVGVLLLTFSVVFFGVVGGVLGFLVLEAALIGVDYLLPNADDAPDAPGNAVR